MRKPLTAGWNGEGTNIMNDPIDIHQPPVEPTYLGDGVYASFDGYHIWLHLGAHNNLH